jgi:hypothetical protein
MPSAHRPHPHRDTPSDRRPHPRARRRLRVSASGAARGGASASAPPSPVVSARTAMDVGGRAAASLTRARHRRPHRERAAAGLTRTRTAAGLPRSPEVSLSGASFFPSSRRRQLPKLALLPFSALATDCRHPPRSCLSPMHVCSTVREGTVWMGLGHARAARGWGVVMWDCVRV